RDPGRLRVDAAEQRARVSRPETLLHGAGPDAARGPQLCDLLEEVVVDVEEEAEARREIVDVEPCADARLYVLDAVPEREGELLDRGRPGLADVITADRDRVPARHVGRGEREDVRDDAHRRPRGIDVGLLGDVLLEDVV